MIQRTVLLLLLMSFGCAFTSSNVGGPLPSAEGLVIGQTTKPEALAQLGAPLLVQRQFDGDLYTWRRTHSRRRSVTILPIYVKAFFFSSGESRSEALSLFFDTNGTLRGIGRRGDPGSD